MPPDHPSLAPPPPGWPAVPPRRIVRAGWLSLALAGGALALNGVWLAGAVAEMQQGRTVGEPLRTVVFAGSILASMVCGLAAWGLGVYALRGARHAPGGGGVRRAAKVGCWLGGSIGWLWALGLVQIALLAAFHFRNV